VFPTRQVHGASPEDERKVCKSTNMCTPVSYDTIARRYGIHHIYLATDSDLTIQQSKKYKEFKWLYAPSDMMGRFLLAGLSGGTDPDLA
jgi:hypothetical protein